MPSSEAWTVAGVLISVIALLLSVIFFVAGRKKRLLKYEISSTTLIAESMTAIPKLNVSFDGQSVKNLISTTVTFTNSGNQLLEPSSFATRQPLTLSASGRFFDVRFKDAATADSSDLAPSIEPIDEHTKKIVFDFLEPKHSFKLTLLHEGELSVSGILKGGRITADTSILDRLALPMIIMYFTLCVALFASLVLTLIAEELYPPLFLLCCLVLFMAYCFYLLHDYLNDIRS